MVLDTLLLYPRKASAMNSFSELVLISDLRDTGINELFSQCFHLDMVALGDSY